ncbi:MAG: pyridoxamine 5'-phosphate oxidase family protein, partial [Pseudomonadota bacterium]|nr:pyridoxamine 5'-phosphate oxidase family protein [Pseudomonadota bacterium]
KIGRRWNSTSVPCSVLVTKLVKEKSMTAMSQDEREAFLADLHVGVLAINDSGHGPLTIPIWYDYQAGGELWFLTGPDSRKGKLLDVGVRVSLVAQTENPPYKYASVEGPISAIEPSSKSELLPMAVRYLGSEAGEQYTETNTGGGGVVVRVTPERWLTVDYAKS